MGKEGLPREVYASTGFTEKGAKTAANYPISVEVIIVYIQGIIPCICFVLRFLPGVWNLRGILECSKRLQIKWVCRGFRATCCLELNADGGR